MTNVKLTAHFRMYISLKHLCILPSIIDRVPILLAHFHHDIRLLGPTSVIRCIWFPPRHTFIRVYICYTVYLISTTTYVYQGLHLIYGVYDFRHETRLSGPTSNIRGIWLTPQLTFIRAYICYTVYLISTTTHGYQGLHLYTGYLISTTNTLIRTYICYTGYLISTTKHVYQDLHLIYGVFDFHHGSRLSGPTSVIRCI